MLNQPGRTPILSYDTISKLGEIDLSEAIVSDDKNKVITSKITLKNLRYSGSEDYFYATYIIKNGDIIEKSMSADDIYATSLVFFSEEILPYAEWRRVYGYILQETYKKMKENNTHNLTGSWIECNVL